MNYEELGKEIYNTSNIQGEFLLRSGETSNEYFDKYLFESKPCLLSNISAQMVNLLPKKFDKLAGLEMGGIPIATALSMKTSREIIFVRKEAKKYGTCKVAEGGLIKGLNLVLIEDVITSGGAVIDAALELRKEGAIIDTVVCVIDRESTGESNLKKYGIEIKPLFTKSFFNSL